MKIGILGATGAVGRQMIQCLEEKEIPVDELRLFASPRSAGLPLLFHGKEVRVQETTREGFQGLEVVFGAVSASLSRTWAPVIQAAGALYIDNSRAFRLCSDVPLVVPEINGRDALEAPAGIIANPNCSTIITLMAVAPVHRLSPLRALIASTYQAVSGAGRKGMEELAGQQKALYENKPPVRAVFPAQIADNVIPWIGKEEEEGYTDEEMKMRNEGRKILHAPDLKVTCTCVRVPVFRSHSISVSLQCQRPVSPAEAEAAIASFPGDRLIKDGFPTPLESSGRDTVLVGRVRPDEVLTGGVSLFCCGDQIRKGAASNAVGILEYLLSQGKL
jgi:aspartate-semialdehyde dehydrogenase